MSYKGCEYCGILVSLGCTAGNGLVLEQILCGHQGAEKFSEIGEILLTLPLKFSLKILPHSAAFPK